MKNFILLLKPWKLFAITFGIAFLFQILSMILILLPMSNRSNVENYVFPFLILFVSLLVLSVLFFFHWIWSICIVFNRKLDKNLSVNLTPFKILRIIPIIYFLLLIATILFSIFYGPIILAFLSSTFALGIVVIIQFFVMLCLFHSIWTAAKIFKTVELNREVKINEFLIEFILLSAFPLGIWVLQPRINQLMKDEDLI